MKTKIFFIFLTCGVFSAILNSQFLLAQWQPDLRLTNDSAESYTSDNNAWSIAASGDIVHAVWYDTRNGNREIYYKRSTNGGMNWGTDMNLSNTNLNSWEPCISVSGQDVHVAWHEFTFSGHDEIWYKHSLDGGASWSTYWRLNYGDIFTGKPSVSTYSQVVHIVWTRGFPVHNSLWYKRSMDAGITWEQQSMLTVTDSVLDYASVSASGPIVHIVWEDNRYGNYEIYYKRSTDGGTSWGLDTRLTTDSSNSEFPCVSASGSVVHVVWENSRSVIYYKRSTDGGSSWGTDTRLTNNYAISWYPSVAVSGTAVNVVWTDTRDGNWEVYYKRNPTGNPIGIQNINSEVPAEFKLGQNYPNPFNSNSKIKMQISKLEGVKLTIYDVLGQEVQTMVNEELKPGTYELTFDGTDFPSGVYYYRLNAGEFTDTKKMVLLK